MVVNVCPHTHKHTHATYVTSPVSCTTLSSVVLPWKEQLSWEVFWPYPALSFNVYLTHARTPLPSYSHVREEYYENTVTLSHMLLLLFTIYQAAGWLTHSGFILTDCSNFTFTPFFHVFKKKKLYRCAVEQWLTRWPTTSSAQKQRSADL